MNSVLSSINQSIVNPLIVLMFAIALVVFLWGVLVFIMNASDETAREKAKNHILYGIIGMFIMISAFGIIRVITGTFNLPEENLDRFER